MQTAKKWGHAWRWLGASVLVCALVSGCGDDSGTGAAAGEGPGGGGASASGGNGGASPDGGSADGGSSEGGAGEGGAVTSYNPCPKTGTCFVMPLGDSITDGAGSSDSSGYRKELRVLVEGASQAMDFVGTTSGPSGHHDGHSGWIIQQIRDDIDAFTTDCTDSTDTHHAPHVILLMIGTNDTNNDLDLANAPARLGDLMDRIAIDVPDALLVVAQITPNGDQNKDTTKVAPFNAAIPDLVATRAALGQHVVMVDMHAPLDPAVDLPDGLHPNDGGYVKMANVWYAVLGPLLPPR